jgi:uncharacterized protein
MINPFVTDRPLPSSELIDREDEAAQLLAFAQGGHNALLTAPRRYGKTTLLHRVMEDARRAGLTVVSVDFYGVVSLAEVALRIEEAYREALEGRLARWYAGAVRAWRPRVRAGVPGARLELQAQPEEETLRLLHHLLDLPQGLFERGGRRTLVVYDEFQALLAASDTFDGLLRSRIQRQGESASYVFAGSHPGLMAELFGTRERPLYGQARPVRLPPLADAPLAEYVGRRFEETERDVGVALEPLLEIVRGHPQRAMLVAHHLWAQTARGETADGETLDRAMRAVFAELQEAFERAWEGFSTNERRVLTAVAWIGPWGQGDSLYSASTLSRFKLTKGTARDVRRALLRRGDLEEADGSVRLVDPLLEAWIASGRRPPH